MTLVFKILGPLEIDDDGASLIIKSRRQRTILSALLLEANQIIPVERLIDALWEYNPPTTARNQIHVCISALRNRFSAAHGELIRTQPPGYLLAADDGMIDVQQFDALVVRGRAQAADGRPEEAIASLTEALALWRDDALAGSGSRLIESAAVTLDERRLAVEEERIGLAMELGRYNDALAEIIRLTARHPLREGLRLHHMTALYRAGRRAEALEVYREARQLFIDEIGIEPGPELRALEKRILAEDATFAQPVPPPATGAVPEQRAAAPLVPRQLPARIADFTGRGCEVDDLRARLEPGEDGPTPIVVITGAAGIGKSTLAVHIAHLMADAYPDGQLYADLHGGRRPAADTVNPVLGRFLRALGTAPALIPDGTEERVGFYRSSMADRRCLVVLDGAASEEEVLPLIPGGSRCAVVVTSQSRLSRLPGAYRVEVGTFEAAEATEFLYRSVEPARISDDHTAVEKVVDLCGRVPIALRIVAAKLAARPHWSLSHLVRLLADEKSRLDNLLFEDLDIRSNLSLAYRNLAPETQKVFRGISLLEHREFPAWVAAAVADVPLADAEELLDQLAEMRLVDIDSSADGEFRFTILNLIRDFSHERLMDEETQESRTAAIHRVATCWLALAREAHRRVYGGDFAVPHTIDPPFPYDDADGTRFIDDPRAWFQAHRAGLVAAIQATARAGLDELCWNLALATATCFEADAHYDDWERTHEIALTAVRAVGNRYGEAAVLYSLGSLGIFRGRLRSAAERLTTALAMFRELAADHGNALALRNLAFIDRTMGRHDLAMSRYETALGLLRQVGDEIVEAHVLSNMAAIHLERGQEDAAETLLNEATAICQRYPNQRISAQVEHRVGELYLHVGLYEAARRSFESVLRIVREAGDPIGTTHALYGLGLVHTAQRRFDRARSAFAESYRIADESGDSFTAARIALAYGQMHIKEGVDTEAVRWLLGALHTFRTVGAPLWQARALVALDDLILDESGQMSVESARSDLLLLLDEVDLALDPALVARLRR